MPFFTKLITQVWAQVCEKH